VVDEPGNPRDPKLRALVVSEVEYEYDTCYTLTVLFETDDGHKIRVGSVPIEKDESMPMVVVFLQNFVEQLKRTVLMYSDIDRYTHD
jgi:hypothetical protein